MKTWRVGLLMIVLIFSMVACSSEKNQDVTVETGESITASEEVMPEASQEMEMEEMKIAADLHNILKKTGYR